MNKNIHTIEDYFNLAKRAEELLKLREIALACGLTENLKWRQPCYSTANGNIVIIGEFKDCSLISFFKGSLLKDPENILQRAGKNAQAGRVLKFKEIREIYEVEAILKTYIHEAIENEKAGLKIEYTVPTEADYPEELQSKLAEDETFKTAWDALTPGRRKGFVLYFGQVRQAKSRIARIENCTHRIMKGKGIFDCICGLSKKMPNCDGSHKQLKD